MKRTQFFNLNLSILFSVALIFACCKKKNSTAKATDDSSFDKQALLTNIADNVIVPSYTTFKTSLDSFIISYTNFETSKSQSDFRRTKQKLDICYLNYQNISMFAFGPGEDLGIRTNFNIFPTNISTINSNINSGTYNLSALTNIAAKGFPALDYLFYGLNQTEVDLINLFVTDVKRRDYTRDLLNDMSVKINSVLSVWNSSYRNTFINSLGTDVGSSIGFVVNQLNYELDYLKNAKLAIPLGLKSGGNVLPAHCEAYYGGQSVQYALETLKSIENIYLGRSNNGLDGLGFDDYLDHLGIAYGEGTLNSAIKARFQIARTSLNALGNPLSGQVVSNPSTVNSTYKELVKLLVLLKTDMPSNLGVVITYQDGDGD